MTREEYIEWQLGLAREAIGKAVAGAGKPVGYWDKSWEPTSIFPEIFEGMLSELYGNNHDLLAKMEALTSLVEVYKTTINQLIASNDNLQVQLAQVYPSWTFLTVDRIS